MTATGKTAEIEWLHAAVCLPCLDFLEHLGAPVERGLERHGLPPGPLDPVDGVLPRRAFLTFIAAMSRAQGIDNLGYRASEWVSDRRLAAPYAPPGAPTLLQALERMLARLNRWCTIDMTLAHGTESVFFCRHSDAASRVHDLQAGGFAFRAILTLVRQYAGSNWTPRTAAAPAELVSQPWFKGETPDTIFSPAAGVWWMEIDRQDLSLSLPGSRQPQLAQESVEVRGVTGGVDGVVRRALGSYPPDRFPSLDLLAERFAVSPRTMKRRLQQADSSYSALLAEVRFDFAADRLETSDQKITDLAFEAGYESAAAFSRAFRRFAGVTPREYRASRVN